MPKKQHIGKDQSNLFIRLADKEFELLERYCMQEQRTKSDVVRELIRSLESKIKD